MWCILQRLPFRVLLYFKMLFANDKVFHGTEGNYLRDSLSPIMSYDLSKSADFGCYLSNNAISWDPGEMPFLLHHLWSGRELPSDPSNQTLRYLKYLALFPNVWLRNIVGSWFGYYNNAYSFSFFMVLIVV